MSVLSIDGDSWRGVLNDAWHLDQPSWDDVDNAVRRLDAKKYTIVTLQGVGEQHMAIGGGGGQYVVYATHDKRAFWSLFGSHAGGRVVLLNAGGQEGDYPASQIVDLSEALAAARTFFVDQRLEPSLRWELH